MDKSLTTGEPTSIDVAIGKTLQKTYGQLTRRSFLSGATRKLISLTGIGVAAQMFPYFANEAHATETCGLHGWICNEFTPCYGGSIGANWIQCCQMNAPRPVFSCCTYTDYCGTRPPNWGDDCYGNEPSGPAWCGGAGGSYICTLFNCSGQWSTLSACQSGCSGSPSC